MVYRLIEQYETNDPFRMAECMDIIVLFEDLGSINGFYNCIYRQKFIHINKNLPTDKQIYVCCHELGHAVLHSDYNVHFFKDNLQGQDVLEVEADMFALQLLFHDCSPVSCEYAANLYGIPKNRVCNFKNSRCVISP